MGTNESKPRTQRDLLSEKLISVQEKNGNVLETDFQDFPDFIFESNETNFDLKHTDTRNTESVSDISNPTSKHASKKQAPTQYHSSGTRIQFSSQETEVPSEPVPD
jgi:hypothetical protein